MTGTSAAGGRPQLAVPRARAIVAGLALVLAMAFVMPYVNLVLRKYDWAFRPLPTGPLFVLFLLVWPLNTLLARFRPRAVFTGPELLLMYAMMALSAPLHYEGLWGYALDFSVYPQYAASPENRWAELFLPHTPLWLQVTQPEAITWFFEGAPAGAPIPWGLWVAPVTTWSLFALALFTFLFCLGCLLRRDWIEGERLTFPMAVLPTELAGDAQPSLRSAFFRSPFLWIGAAFPVGQSLLQMAHALAPAVPYSPLFYHLGRAFAGNGPFNSWANTYAYIGFDNIGLFGLLPVEVSFSLWLFFLLNRLQVLAFAALGFGQEGAAARLFSPTAFIAFQEAGGCIMLALLLLWQVRRPLAVAARSLFGGPLPHDPLAPLSLRAALIGLLVSGLGLVLWAAKAGMDLWVFVAAMGVFFAYSLSMARLVTASGVYVPDVSMSPRDLLVAVGGAARFPVRSLTMLTYLQGVFLIMPKLSFLHYSLNDFKIAHGARLSGRVLAVCLAAAVLLMMVVVPWVDLWVAYRRGALTFDLWLFRDAGSWQFGQLATSLRTPEAPAPYIGLGLGFGAAVMLALSWMHARYLWWALSPIGFVMGGTWGMRDRMWANAFIAWVLVVALRRVGGLRLYRTVRPAFLGMVLGHLVMMGFRSLLDPVLGLGMHLAAWD